jgi:hypothetical protein
MFCSGGAKRQPANADALLLKHDQAALLKRVRQLREVDEHERANLVSSVKCQPAKENDRRPSVLPRGEQQAEIHVGRDQDALFLRTVDKDLLVRRALQAVVARVDCIVASSPQTFGNPHDL